MTWPMVKLGVVAPAKPIKPPKIADSHSVWLLNLDMVESHTGRVIEKLFCSSDEAGASTHWFDENYVLYSKLRPYLNKVVVPDGLGLATTELVPMLPDPKRLDRKYLAYYLRSEQFVRWVNEQVAGAKMPRVSMKIFWEHEIPLPSLEEQKRIAAILDKADSIRQKRQQAMALADDFLRSVFLDMFGDPVTNPKGWEIQPISKMAEVQGGLQVTKKREGLPVTCPYLRVANVYRGRLELSEIKTMQVTEAEQERVALVKNDILIVEGHGNKEEIGRCAMWDGSIENIIHQNHLIRVRVINNRILPQYLTDFINSEGGRAQLIGASNTTSGLNTISTRLVKETAVLIPDLHTQERYIKIFKKVTETLSCFQQGTLGGKELFESLSQKAFTGQL